MRNPRVPFAGAMILIALALGCRSGGARSAGASGPDCLPRTEETDALLMHIRELTDDRGAYARHERSAAALPVVAKVDVLPIEEPFICAEAASAYDRVRTRATPGAPVLVIRVGDRYVVYDPGPVEGEATVLITFDRSFSRALAQWRY